MTPAPRRRRNQMRVHREGESRCATARGDMADRVTDLAVLGATAAELGRDECLEEALLLEPLVAFRHEAFIGIVPRGGLSDLAGNGVGAGEPIDAARAGLTRIDPCDDCGCHVSLPKKPRGFACRRRPSV